MFKGWLLPFGLLVLYVGLGQQPALALESQHFTTADVWSINGRGYSPPPAEINASELTGPWDRVTLPYVLPPQPMLGQAANKPGDMSTAVTWYRLEVPELPEPDEPLYLYIPRWNADGQIAVYADKRLLYQSHAKTLLNVWNIPLWISLDSSSQALVPKFIWVRIQRPRESGGGISTVWLGEGVSLSLSYHLRYFLQTKLPYMGSAAFMIAGFFSLFLWLKQRREPFYGWIFAVASASFLHTLQYHIDENRLLMSSEWFSWLMLNSLFWLTAGVHFFLNQFHGRVWRNLDRVVMATTVSLGLLTLPGVTASSIPYVLGPVAYAVVMLVAVLLGGLGFVKSRQARSIDGQLLASWYLLGMFLGLYDWWLQSYHVNIESIYLGPYANFLAFMLFLYIMFRRYVGAMDEVKKINANLALRLQAREQELQLIHAAQREAAHRQTLTDERQRLMQDMHDGMGSSLCSALLAVGNGQLDASKVADVLKNCIDDLKLTIDAMEPVQADLPLLLATLRFRLGPRLEVAGIAMRWNVTDVPELDWLDPRNALHILRILQEAITNVIKHTHATVITVATAVEPDWVRVSVTDNGQGFDVVQALASPGKGLTNQLRRAQAIGAEIVRESSNSGSQLILRLPILQA